MSVLHNYRTVKGSKLRFINITLQLKSNQAS